MFEDRRKPTNENRRWMIDGLVKVVQNLHAEGQHSRAEAIEIARDYLKTDSRLRQGLRTWLEENIARCTAEMKLGDAGWQMNHMAERSAYRKVLDEIARLDAAEETV